MTGTDRFSLEGLQNAWHGGRAQERVLGAPVEDRTGLAAVNFLLTLNPLLTLCGQKRPVRASLGRSSTGIRVNAIFSVNLAFTH